MTMSRVLCVAVLLAALAESSSAESKNLTMLYELYPPGSELPLTKGINSSYYYFAMYPSVGWYEAGQFCRRHGMHLTNVENEEEHQFIVDTLWEIELGYGYFAYWTSGNDLGDTGSYIWASTGEKVNYTQWLPNEPSGGVEHCISYVHPYNSAVSILMNDAECNVSFKFICKTICDENCLV